MNFTIKSYQYGEQNFWINGRNELMITRVDGEPAISCCDQGQLEGYPVTCIYEDLEITARKWWKRFMSEGGYGE